MRVALAKYVYVVAAMIAFASCSHAQDGRNVPDIPLFPRDSIQPGLRVRLFSPGFLFRHTGAVRNLVGDTLVFQSETERQVMRIPLHRLNTLEVSTERRLTSARLVSSAGVGLVTGFVASRFLQFAVLKTDNRSCRIFKCIGPLNIGVSLAGLGAGVLFAMDHPSDNWRLVTVR